MKQLPYTLPYSQPRTALAWKNLNGRMEPGFHVLAYFAVTYLNARNVILGGTGDMAIAACCAAIFCFDTLSQVTDVMVEDMPDTLTWQDGPDGTVAKRTMAAFVPDLVVWGDIRMLETILDKIDTGFREVTA